MNRQPTGNGDICPSDPEHGRMYALPKSQRQFCPNVAHSRVADPAVFEWDGVTPASNGLSPRQASVPGSRHPPSAATSGASRWSELPAFKRPEPRCPKCGEQYGFLQSRPMYEPATSTNAELLRWECTNCRYEVQTRTADAK